MTSSPLLTFVMIIILTAIPTGPNRWSASLQSLVSVIKNPCYIDMGINIFAYIICTNAISLFPNIRIKIKILIGLLF